MFASVMKKNRTTILFLLFAFTFSNVGLPFTVHFCAMMEKMSKEKCMSCRNQTEQIERSCCDKENKEKVRLSSFGMNCCESKIAAEPLNEKFISSSFGLLKIEYKIFQYSIPENIYFLQINFDRNFISDTSPPITYSNNLYLNNSILLI